MLEAFNTHDYAYIVGHSLAEQFPVEERLSMSQVILGAQSISTSAPTSLSQVNIAESRAKWNSSGKSLIVKFRDKNEASS